MSLALAIALCFVFGLRGLAFIAGIAATTVILFLLGGFVQNVLMARRYKRDPL
jgi:hypothetical protein